MPCLKKTKTKTRNKNCQAHDKATMISLHQILIAIYQTTKVHLHNYNQIKQFYQKKKKGKHSLCFKLKSDKLFMSSFFKKGKTFFFFFGRARQHLFLKKKFKKNL